MITKIGLNIYTHGFDFILGKNALDNYNDTLIYAGYDKNFDSTQKAPVSISIREPFNYYI